MRKWIAVVSMVMLAGSVHAATPAEKCAKRPPDCKPGFSLASYAKPSEVTSNATPQRGAKSQQPRSERPRQPRPCVTLAFV
jgi:murein endopeptidase